MNLEAVGRIIDYLFLQLPALVVTTREAEEGSSLLKAAEIDAAVNRIRDNARKAPRPDGIPDSVWAIVHRANHRILATVFNSVLKNGVFPT